MGENGPYYSFLNGVGVFIIFRHGTNPVIFRFACVLLRHLLNFKVLMKEILVVKLSHVVSE